MRPGGGGGVMTGAAVNMVCMTAPLLRWLCLISGAACFGQHLVGFTWCSAVASLAGGHHGSAEAVSDSVRFTQ